MEDVITMVNRNRQNAAMRDAERMLEMPQDAEFEDYDVTEEERALKREQTAETVRAILRVAVAAAAWALWAKGIVLTEVLLAALITEGVVLR